MEKSCMNKTAAKEWLRIAYHDLLSAKILYDAKHFTDSIGCDIQQSIEKVFKAILASKNRKIPKSHDLIELYSYIENEIEIDDFQLELLARATEYYTEERYPNPNYELPSRKEIKEVLNFAEELFDRICANLQIDIKDL